VPLGATGGRVGRCLGPREAQVWYASSETVNEPALLRHCYAALGREERAQAQRLRSTHNRHAYVVAHALTRRVLSLYAAADPVAWVFKVSHYGKPEVAAPRGVPPLRFNLSHTRGMAACAVTLERDIGVDVEDESRSVNVLDLAAGFFAPLELAALRAEGSTARQARFFEYWTLKECYIKARGFGLSLPIDAFWFDVSAAREITISIDPRLGDDPRGWQFHLFRPTRRHLLAVGIRRGADPAWRVEIQDGLPLLLGDRAQNE